ncbi:hypothetical protein PHYPSEUDO_014677 [Phytophthora pseudosyringae]|uniref:WW domain-containing protein n=1 Tax=Phytophthora pseudosyringae TaxID=221518 RepID=A0A8T1W0N6_9STRA|nr:hypothetical protein PHYPSEUDO_014677 [Phytophthora pseudosyringae]
MERFVASAPLPQGHPSYPPSVSPLSMSSPASVTPTEQPPIPFSAIQSCSDADEGDDAGGSDSDLIPPPESDSNLSIPHSDILSERQLIARGRVLLQAYQSQKKQWLQSGGYDSSQAQEVQVPDSPDSTVNIFHPMMDSNGEYSTLGYSSPTKRAVAAADGPSIDTKLEEFSPPPPPPRSPPPGSIVSGLSNFSIGPLPTSELRMNQPLSGNRSEKGWTDFMQLLKTNGRMMDTVDTELAGIWSELVSADEHARGPQTSVNKLSEAVTLLLQQKREVEIAIAKLAEVLGSRVFLAGKMSDDAVQFVNNQLRLELEASQALVDKVRAESISHKREESGAVNGTGRSEEIANLLRQQLQDNKEQLQASQAAVAKLKDQLAHQKKAAAGKQAQFERALAIKLREIDALCSDIDLPAGYERIKTTEGVACYRRKGGAGANTLEDPRVPVAIEQRSAAASTAISVDKETIPGSIEMASPSTMHHPRGVSAIARDYAAPDNVLRRSFSTPHILHDSNAFEDIHVPPDDGRKHTIEDFSTPLPAGWEMRVTASGAVFFFNKYTTTTTWTDPRLLGTASTSPSAVNVFSQQKPIVRNSSATASESGQSRSNSTAVHADALQSVLGEEDDGVKYLDVVFEENGPIGIHFQANVPDAGATVRNLLQDMAAAKKNVMEPFDELVAVNKNAVDSAPFRHVMLLLQGGLRPLTLTFKRDLNRPRLPTPPLVAAPSSGGDSSSLSGSDVLSVTHLDEEVLIDEGTVVDLEQLRVPVASSQSQPPSNSAATASGGDEDEDMNVADVIITNIFSLFWKPPETTGEVQTV